MNNEAQLKKEILMQLFRYLQAVVDNAPESLRVSDSLRATYNGKEVVFGKTELWKYVVRFPARQTFADAKTRTAILIGTATNEALFDNGTKANPKNRPGNPNNMRSEDMNRSDTHWWYYAVRLTLDESLAIAEVEEITVAEKLVHNDVHASQYADRILKLDNYIPESERSSKEEMIAVAQKYWEGLQKTIAPEDIPVHPDCGRLELGVECVNARRNFYTLQSNFRSKLFHWKINNRRWYIVDEARGIVVCIATFCQFDEHTPPGFVAVEVFKIECGLIRDVAAMFKPMCTESGWPDIE